MDLIQQQLDQLRNRTAPDPLGGRGTLPQPQPPAMPLMGLVFRGRVEKDGGQAGGAAANCTWTYTVKDLAGNTLRHAEGSLATGLTPQKARYCLMEYWYAGEDRGEAGGATSTYCTYCRDSAGNVVLLEALGEIDKDTECPA